MEDACRSATASTARACLPSCTREDVPADNNASERALRKPVVHRKVSGGFHSTCGAEAYATVATVLQTAREHGHDALETFIDALGPSIDDSLLLQRT